MGSHGMRARTRRSRGLSEAVSTVAVRWSYDHGRSPLQDIDAFAKDVERQLRSQGLEVADIGGPWVDRSADDQHR